MKEWSNEWRNDQMGEWINEWMNGGTKVTKHKYLMTSKWPIGDYLWTICIPMANQLGTLLDQLECTSALWAEITHVFVKLIRCFLLDLPRKILYSNSNWGTMECTSLLQEKPRISTNLDGDWASGLGTPTGRTVKSASLGHLLHIWEICFMED